MGKEMTINKTPFGVGLALEIGWMVFSQECSSMIHKLFNKLMCATRFF